MIPKLWVGAGGWCSLSAAIVFGVMGTLSLKLSHGLRELKHTLATALFYGLSFVAMTSAVQTLDLSVVYSIWSGAGTVMAAFFGLVVFKEKLSWRKALFLFCIIIGMLGVEHGSRL